MNYDDCPPHPTFLAAKELTGVEGTKYPLHVNASHPNDRLHSQLCGTLWRKDYAIGGREPCVIHPDDAAKRGIKDGDLVRVFNDRGQILTGARISEDTMPGVIRIYEGGWYTPSDPLKEGSLDTYSDVNVLTFDVGTSRLAQGNCGHSAAADVEKFTGTPSEVTVFTTPAVAE
ncbi:molybdopterin dinucleotide binding domain-containing protein [Breoghania sp.]|uniref:molybdopterin dinucleotide binding domain-containing protein n=1 Tax=Breoghania sp. TaxID=2065378 RepID=UPI002626E1E4|nr:molybdopterin dinucleotide binding domain-containing protein [Breoghania sp.]MDJ0929737.1 molybdopterin dinucleotide binding domain-containing protein [Breoghania sp.]